MRTYSILRWLTAALAISACAQNTNPLSKTYLDRFAAADPRLEDFTECHGFGCTEVSASLVEQGCVASRRRSIPPSSQGSAKAERQRIAHAVALMQLLVGEQTGTAAHQWTHKAMLVLPNFGDKTQLDCIDEAVNTWTYLTLMKRDKLFRFHRVAQLAYAGSLTAHSIFVTQPYCRKSAADISRSTPAWRMPACRRRSCRSRLGLLLGRPIFL